MVTLRSKALKTTQWASSLWASAIHGLLRRNRLKNRKGNSRDNDQVQLDAFGKGTGKGWTHNVGKCYVCNGDGHIARFCPSAQGPDGKATGTDECYGCHGKSHRKDVCPTVNPKSKGCRDAKGGGKSWGKGKGSGGKGWGGNGKGSGGKGWGEGKGKGGGLYDLDLWQGGGGESGSDWSGWGD